MIRQIHSHSAWVAGTTEIHLRAPHHGATCVQHSMDRFWSMFSMPIGVAFCFGPVLVAWWLAERKAKRDGDGEERR